MPHSALQSFLFAGIFILATSPLFGQSIVILGIAQDAGYPQAACQRDCCRALWETGEKGARVASLGILDSSGEQSWMIDATPDFPSQLNDLEKYAPLSGIFLTHAHIGHYTGLMYLGREVMGAANMPVYAMPRMKGFLESHGPWSQLAKLENIYINPLLSDTVVHLTEELQVIPLLVPHRDEFSETVGFLIQGRQQSALYLPDIDKWQLWERDILQLIRAVDYALLDATFFENGEIPNRDMSEIPHPFVEESMALFEGLPEKEKSKIYFIHFNHTNPLLKAHSAAKQKVESAGFHVAEEGLILPLDIEKD
jgi:pyrroloquinoline quinone biosynthesis protein B